MATRLINLEFRHRSYYYRVSFTLNRKTFAIRMSLDTADPTAARERAARMDLALRQQWREIVATSTPLSDDDRKSIMRSAALTARRNLLGIELEHQTTAHDRPRDGQLDQLRSLHGLELVLRDICARGLRRPFGTQEYEMHVLGDAVLDADGLIRLREIISGADELVGGYEKGAIEALRRRNLDPTPVNVAAAAREMAIGSLLAVREAITNTLDPEAAIEAAIALLEMPGSDTRTDVGAVAIPAPDRVTPPPSQPASSSASIGTPMIMSIKAAAAAFLAAHPRYDDDSTMSVWTPKTRSQFEAAVFLAHKHFGEVAVTAIDELALAEFVRTLRRLPANHHKTPTHAALSLQEIAERGKGTTLGIATINRHVRFLKLVLDWAWKRSGVPILVDWSPFISTDRRLKRDKRPAFTEAELEMLFTGAVWHGAESIVRRTKPGSHIIWDSAYWVPILLAYTGARREEIAKLAVDDVERIDGVWAIRIRPNAGGRLKNAASERDVPIAQAVLDLRFLEFVERQREEGQVFLFPELRRAGGSTGTTGTMGDVFYKKWWRAFERAGLVPAGKDIHSMRHYVSTTLAALDVSEERRADLLGHTITSETAGTYTKRTPITVMKGAVDLLPHVTRTAGQRFPT